MCKLKFKDILNQKDGITKGPFGGDIKKAYFVPKGDSTYKVYEQGVVYEKNINYGTYYIDKERFEKLKKFRVETGDLLLTGAGTLGELFEVPKEHEPGVINQALLRIRLNESVVDKEFFKFYFKWYIKDIVCRINGDSVIPNLPPIAMLKETEIDIPGIALQRKISKVLTTLENKLNNNKKINVELEAMAKTIYDYWFLQFEFPNEEGKPYKSSGGKMVWCDELKQEIPACWKPAKVKYCINHINTGLNPRDNFKLGNGSVKYITVKNLTTDGTIDFKNCDVIDEDARNIVHMRSDVSKNDILFASIAPLGRCTIVQENPKDWDINESVFCIRPKLEKVSPEYLYLFLTSDYFVKKAEHSSTGSIFSGIRISVLEDMPILIPDKTTMDNFTKAASKLLFMKYKNRMENQELASLRDFLLPMLMNGQVGFKS